MRRGTAAFAFALSLLVLVAATRGAPVAAADDPREAKGRALFVKGEYQSALEIYATLFSEKNDSIYLRNIGRCFQKLRQPTRAIESFREYLRREPRLRASERRDIEGFIREMKALKAEQDAESAAASSSAATHPPPPPPPAVGTASAAADVNKSTVPPQAGTISSGDGAASGESSPKTKTKTTTLAMTGAGAGSKPASPILIDKGPEGGASRADEDRSVFKRWWFWTGVGAVIAGGVVAAVFLRGGGTTRPDCEPGFTCPRN